MSPRLLRAQGWHAHVVLKMPMVTARELRSTARRPWFDEFTSIGLVLLICELIACD